MLVWHWLEGGSGGGEESTPAVSDEPPPATKYVSAWNAAASSVSGRTYTGVYQLYNGGSHGFTLVISDGERKVGGGRWEVTGYRLTLYNDTGSVYSGEFSPGNITSVTLYTATDSTLELSR